MGLHVACGRLVPEGVISLARRFRSLWSGVLPHEAGCSRAAGRRSRGGSDVPGAPQTIQALSGEASADRPFRGKKGRSATLPSTFRLRRRLSRLGSRVLCALVSLSLVLSLLVGPHVAYAAWVPLGDFEVTAAMLDAAFGWAAAGLTGISAGAMGAVGGVAAVGGYSLWAAENPEEASQFEQYLADNVVSQEVGSSQQLAMNLDAMPSTLKDNIIDYVADTYKSATSMPNIPDSVSYPGISSNVFGGNFTTINGGSVYLSVPTAAINALNSRDNVACFYTWYRTYAQSGRFAEIIAFTKPLVLYSEDVENHTLTFVSTDGSNFNILTINGSGNVSTTYNRASITFGYWATNEHRFMCPYGINFGDGFVTIPSVSGVTDGVSTAFGNLVAGTGTAADVAIAGGVEAIYLPNVSINDGAVVVDDAYEVSGVTYPDIAITLNGSGGTVPLPDDVLTALQQIIGLLTPMGIVSGIPPIVQDIDTKMGAIVDTWPGVMDILDGLGLLPPIVQDIADGMGAIIDIPQSLEDITDILLPIPQSLQGLLDGVTIDIPQTLDQILNGTLSIPTAIDGVVSGVAALPAAIAGALDIDWVLENTEELKDRLPDLDAPLILPQASFEDLKEVANDYKERTPLGKIFEAYEGTFEVMSTSPQGAPRYEITFPSPINFSFVIDFAIFDGLFVQLAHAFFYLLAIFWYLKFLKSVKGWVDSWLTFDGKFFHVAGEEAGASWE